MQIFCFYGRDMGRGDIGIGAGRFSGLDGGWNGCSTGEDMLVLGLKDRGLAAVSEVLMRNGRRRV